MRNKLTKSCSSRSPRKGLSLIEAVLGIALLGTLLTSMLLAGAKLIRQGHASDQSRRASQLADNLMSDWWNGVRDMPRNGSGQVDGSDGWTWSTSTKEWQDPNVASLKAHILKLSVYAPGAKRREPSAQVEVMLSATQPSGS